MNSRKTTSSDRKASQITASAFVSKPDRMEQRLREQYEVGRAAVAAETAKGTKTDQYAKEHNLNPHSLRKLKAFARADYVSGDTQTKGRTSLEELCRHRRKNPSRPSSRLGLHWGHVVILLGIGTASGRQQWAQTAAKNNWSPQRLHAELRKGKPAGRGRPLMKPGTPLDGLAQAVREGTKWIARCELVVTTCETAIEECQDSATRQLVDQLLKHWQAVARKLPDLGGRLQAVSASKSARQSRARASR